MILTTILNIIIFLLTIFWGYIFMLNLGWYIGILHQAEESRFPLLFLIIFASSLGIFIVFNIVF